MGLWPDGGHQASQAEASPLTASLAPSLGNLGRGYVLRAGREQKIGRHRGGKRGLEGQRSPVPAPRSIVSCETLAAMQALGNVA
jgi:hypothetical protein